MKSLLIICSVVAWLFLLSCASKPIDKAFAGKMDIFEEIKTIVDYCQSCHVHRDFNPVDHLNEIPSSYGSEPFRSAEDCKTCHSIDRNFWNDIVRYTSFPKGRIVSE